MSKYTACFVLANPDGVSSEAVNVTFSEKLLRDVERRKRSVRALLPNGEARRIISCYIAADAVQDASQIGSVEVIRP